jgi:hypothetical protein
MQVTIKKYNQSLGEIFQSTAARMAFIHPVGDDWETCHPMVKCKDFLHDAATCMFIKGRTTCIYGFRYDPSKMPHIQTDRICLFVTGINENAANNSLSIIGEIEKLNGTGTTVSIPASNGFIFIGPPAWMGSPAAISCFSGMMRVGLYEGCNGDLADCFKRIVKGHNGNDPAYINQAGPSKCAEKLGGILTDESISWKNFNYGHLGSHVLHHGCGWVAYCRGIYATSKGASDSAYSTNNTGYGK